MTCEIMPLTSRSKQEAVVCVDHSADVVTFSQFDFMRRVKEVRKKLDMVGAMLGNVKGGT